MTTKKEIEIKLSMLKTFNNPSKRLEQYTTPSSIAADILWNAYMLKDIENKTICDICAGTGILGIGALMLKAKKVFFIEIDEKAIEILKENINNKNIEIIKGDARKVRVNCDTALINPPFGTSHKGIDIEIIKNNNHIPIIYSFHLSPTINAVKRKMIELNREITHEYGYRFLIRNTMRHHTKSKHYTEIRVLRTKKVINND